MKNPVKRAGFALLAFITWERTAAPTSMNANESRTASLIERMKPPRRIGRTWGRELATLGKFTSGARVCVKAKKEGKREKGGRKTNQKETPGRRNNRGRRNYAII